MINYIIGFIVSFSITFGLLGSCILLFAYIFRFVDSLLTGVYYAIKSATNNKEYIDDEGFEKETFV